MHRTRKKKKISEITQTRTQVVCERDRTSNLPDEVLVHILSFLHMKCVARTSILSTRWRYLWTWNPSLDFSRCKPTDIDRCLDLHRAPKLRSLKYCSIFYGDTETEALSRWLRYAATHSVEELSLFHPYNYNYPLSLFECQTLMQLTLTNGKLNLSVNFRGFKSLVTVCLERVFIKEEVLCTLISTCDLLENLEVICCSFAEKRLRISATNSSRLRNLKIMSFQETLTNGKLNFSVNFRGFKSLVTVCLDRVFIKEEVLCTLISTCDLLENLEVIYCSFAEKRLRISATNSSRLRNLKIISFQEHRGPGTLEINTPSLLFFTCRGWKLSWSDFSHLHEAGLRFISFDSSWNEDLEGWRRLLSAMTSLRTLFAGDWLFQKPKCRKHLPVPFHDHFVFKNLKELDVFIEHKESKDYLASFISLLKACPAVETVRLYLVSGLERDRCVRYDKVRLWLKEIHDPIFSHDRLKTLELGGFMSTKTELLLLKFLLEKTIALESLILTLRKKIINSESELLKNELTLHKASPNAQILISHI